MKNRIVPILTGLLLTALLCLIFRSEWRPLQSVTNSLENWAYDMLVRNAYKPLGKNPGIAIIDIDNQSLQAIGKWPWPRNVLARIVDKAKVNGALVVAFDLTFPEETKNIAQEVLKNVPQSDPTIVNALVKKFDYDGQFAASLKKQESILAFTFEEAGKPIGQLPKPIGILKEKIQIPEPPSYSGNIDVLQKAAKWGGAINATPDSDGVLRYSPLIFNYKNGLYPSLGLQAAAVYLLADHVEPVTHTYGDASVLEGIKLDQLFIPTDPYGKILIPFRGGPYSFPYISAIDLLNNKVAKAQIQNKLLFIGSSATGLGDVVATSMSPVFAGVEVHASIASGIIDNYLPQEPAWGQGVTLLMISILGAIASVLFPLLGPLRALFGALLLSLLIVCFNYFLFTKATLVTPLFFPVFVVLVIAAFNLIYGYLLESRKRREIKATFGEYVPPEYVDIMLKKGHVNTEGESKPLTVLFSDIVDFTKISEKLTAPKLKEMLNLYLTPITEVIFNTHGTIDKYVGDMVMAFWGAPIANPTHAKTAVAAAIAMRKKMEEINQRLKTAGFQEINAGIGLNTGIMNVGDMGSKFRKAYTVIGDSVNLASRLETLTRKYHVSILVGEECWHECRDDFTFQLIDKVQVKGKEEPINIYYPHCLAREAKDALKEELARASAALDAYFKQDWYRAEKMFTELAKTIPEREQLYHVYLDRIEIYKHSPPPQNWDGAHKFTEK